MCIASSILALGRSFALFRGVFIIFRIRLNRGIRAVIKIGRGGRDLSLLCLQFCQLMHYLNHQKAYTYTNQI